MTYIIRNPNRFEEWLEKAKEELPFDCSFEAKSAKPQRHQEMMLFLADFSYVCQTQGPNEYNKVITLCDERVAKMRIAIKNGEKKVQFEENSNCL